MEAAGAKSQRKIDEVSGGTDSIVIGGLPPAAQPMTAACSTRLLRQLRPLSPLGYETRVGSSNPSGRSSSLHDGVHRPSALTIGRLPATCDLPDPAKVEPMRLPRTHGTAAFLPDAKGSEKSGQGQTGAEHVKSVRTTLEASSLTCCTIGGSLCHRAGSAEVLGGRERKRRNR